MPYKRLNLTDSILEVYPELCLEILQILHKKNKLGPPVKNLSGSRCWQYLGPTNAAGYGLYSICRQDIIPGYNFCGLAHRVSYMVWHGEIPEGKNVLHRCNNPMCINPDHLYAGTKKDNGRDASCNRLIPHPTDGSWKLSKAQVMHIRELKKLGYKAKHIAEIFDVSVGTIYNVINRITQKYY